MGFGYWPPKRKTGLKGPWLNLCAIAAGSPGDSPQDWHPQDHISPEEGDDTDSATLKAVRCAYRLHGDDNKCNHCRQSEPVERREVQRLAFQHGSRF